MADVSGDFELHITVPFRPDVLAAFAERHGVKFSHIELDRGYTPSQPMITIRGSGTLAAQHKLVREWERKLRDVGMHPNRIKIEAAPWNEGIPQSDEDAVGEPVGRYFEHHIKLRLPDASAARLIALTHLVVPHGARLSRNARRQNVDGVQERFVTQRCHHVGRPTARRQLDTLIGALRDDGHEIAEVEQEYVVHDAGHHLDNGWMGETTFFDNTERENRKRHAPEGSDGYPSTYRPLPDQPGTHQRAAFDPALKQYTNAYRAGEPQFDDLGVQIAWRDARRAAMAHLLRIVVDSPYAQNLVLRGSVTLSAWIGDAAREPGDLDFVVVPNDLSLTDPTAQQMLDDIITAVRENPAAGLSAEGVAAADIWTYERAPGRRLSFPFAVAGVASGAIQLDFVFNEKLPLPPQLLHLPLIDRPVLAASPQLSLIWKLLWLESDMWPQGKDLYDATLLAKYTTVPLDLVREMLRPELGDGADSFTAASVLRWSMDWKNFRDEYPLVTGDATAWQERLALALGRSFGEIDDIPGRPVTFDTDGEQHP